MERKNERLPIFTERFRELQGERSNTEFSDFLGISRQSVGFYLNGDRVPDAITLIKIAEKCDVSSDWLLGLSKVRSRDGEKQQVCNYTGLSPCAVHNLHMETLSNVHPGIERFSIRLINKIAESTGHILDCYAWKAGLCAFNMEQSADVYKPDSEIISAMVADTFGKRDTDDLGMVVLPVRDAARFYRDETAKYTEITAQLIIDEYIEEYVRKEFSHSSKNH